MGTTNRGICVGPLQANRDETGTTIESPQHSIVCSPNHSNGRIRKGRPNGLFPSILCSLFNPASKLIVVYILVDGVGIIELERNIACGISGRE